MSRVVWLSYPLGLQDPRPPAIPPPALAPLYTVAADGASVHTLTIASHTGTHVDSPAHVIEGGVPITAFDPEELIFSSPALVELDLGDAAVVMPSHLEPWRSPLQSADIALFRFGTAATRRVDPERFSLRSPGFGVESARWLRRSCPRLHAVGMDIPSLSCIASLEETMAAHNELLGGEGCRILVIEDMDLAHDLTGLREVRLSPWLVLGMDSAPCSVVGIIVELREDTRHA